MAFYTHQELLDLPFKYIGKNVLVSKDARIYNPEQISIGDNSRIDDFCVLSGSIIIGRNVHIAVFCNIAEGEKGVEIKDFAGFAYGVSAFSKSDDYTGGTLTNPTVPDCYKKEIKEKVIIGKHVIVGTNSVIFPGVHVQEGCSIGAMSLVNKSTIPWKMYAGIPAKPIKDRNKSLLDMERQYLAEEK